MSSKKTSGELRVSSAEKAPMRSCVRPGMHTCHARVIARIPKKNPGYGLVVGPVHPCYALFARNNMANRFGADILIQALDPKKAAFFYVNHLGFEITDNNPKMIGLHGQHINLFIEPGPPLGPVLEVTVDNVAGARQRLVEQGCEVVKDEPDFPRCYIKDPFGLIYNLTS
jgi:glyoxalase/bleomycin resistance protein/dioxygenase superfamily protein